MRDAVKSGWYAVKDREKAYYHYAQNSTPNISRSQHTTTYTEPDRKDNKRKIASNSLAQKKNSENTIEIGIKINN